MFIPTHAIRPCQLKDAYGLSLFLANDRSRTVFLVGEGNDGHAVCLEGVAPGQAFPAHAGAAWSGLIIEAVTIEVDLTSRIDLNRVELPTLALVREAETLSTRCQIDGGFSRTGRIQLTSGLPAGGESAPEAFSRWRIVRENGHELQQLHVVDVTPAK